MPVLADDDTSGPCKGRYLLQVMVNELSSQILALDGLRAEDGVTLCQWITLIDQDVGTRLLIMDDANGFKQALAGEQKVGSSEARSRV
jgi:hypothetical protein